MRKTVLMLTLLAVAPVFALHANPAVAQRVFVAAQGLDSNPCSFALPCRTFQHAHDIVAAGGEIDVLDPAGYGLLNITKAISIQGHGFSGISAPSGDAITVNAGASDKVNLNGLLLDGVGTGGNGILVNTGPSVNVLNSLIRNFTSDGIRMNSSNSTVSLTVSSTSILDNGGSGITIDPVGPNQIVSVGLNRVEMNHNANGLNVNNTHSTGGSIDVAMADSVAMKNIFGCVLNTNLIGPVTHVLLLRSVASNNETGVVVNGGQSTVWLAQSMLSGNFVAWTRDAVSVLYSYGDNYIDANGSNNVPPPFSAPRR